MHENKFWVYSCAVYANEEVKAACLRMQDRFGLNVNVLLYCLYLGQQQKLINQEQFERLACTLSPWHENITRPLRQLRRKIKTHAASDLSVYNKITEAEIASEREEQNLIESALGRGETAREMDSPNAVTVQNLKRYCRSRGVILLTEIVDLIERLSTKASFQ